MIFFAVAANRMPGSCSDFAFFEFCDVQGERFLDILVAEVLMYA